MIQTRDYKRIHEMRKVNWEDTREMRMVRMREIDR